jgi:hypothetical protein
MTGITAKLRGSAFTFRQGTLEKASFILLNQLDLTLTVLATHFGLKELNPLITPFINIPAMLLLVKLFIPVLLAWLIPGRLLLPSIALLALILLWNVKELVLFLL